MAGRKHGHQAYSCPSQSISLTVLSLGGLSRGRPAGSTRLDSQWCPWGPTCKRQCHRPDLFYDLWASWRYGLWTRANIPYHRQSIPLGLYSRTFQSRSSGRYHFFDGVRQSLEWQDSLEGLGFEAILGPYASFWALYKEWYRMVM